MRFLLLLPLLLGAALSVAAELPAEVADHLARRELCQHFRDEPWPEGNSLEDRERRSHIVSQIDSNCTGLEQAGQDLRRRYIGQPSVIRELDRSSVSVPSQ